MAQPKRIQNSTSDGKRVETLAVNEATPFERFRGSQAKRLRQAGSVPASVGIWAAANPVIERDASRLQAKVAAGAESFLTQPPLAWYGFQEWMYDACRRGVAEECDVLVGIPMLTSSRNLGFWIQLCSAPFAGEQKSLWDKWRANEQNMSRDEFDAFCLEWNRNLIQQVKGTKGVAGFHVMPFGKKGREITAALVEDGTLQ